ncbi:MAG: hypothetical protein KDI71_02865 [Xanthomonadales bacterium]|nr:hypothetical protein [Xanthomonadales bacterium]
MLSTLQRTQATQLLDKYLGRYENSLFISLGELDGRALVFVSRLGEQKQHGISALSSSSLALAETFVKETLGGQAQYGLVNSESGNLVTVRVPKPDRGYVLSLGTDRQASPAIALRAALDAASEVSALLP